MVTLKFWKWFRRGKKKEQSLGPIIKREYNPQKGEQVNIIPPLDDNYVQQKAKNGALITSPSDLYLQKCKVLNDHSIEFKLEKNKKTAKMLRSSHLLTIPIRDFMPNRFIRFLCFYFNIKYLKVNCYTVQFDGEVTHDPHIDELDEELKKKFEKVLELEATVIKTNWAKNIMSGMKDKMTWWESLGPLLVIGFIVFIFLFAFQIQPNL